MNNERIAAIIIPDFLLELCYRQDSSLRSDPLALTEHKNKSAPIIAMNQPAAENRVACKMTASQAHALCPELVVLAHNHDRAGDESRKLQKVLRTIGPLVEEETPGIYFMEISGLRRLHGSEIKITQSIISLIKSHGYPVRVGIAESKFIARVAAETSMVDDVTIVNKGDDITFIEKLDIDRLQLSDDIRDKLRQLGLKKIGQLSFFPSNEMSARFGSEGARLSQLSHGQDSARLLREWPEDALSNEISLTYRIYNAATIVNYAEKLLRPLFEKLGQSGLGCHGLEITITLEDHTHELISLSVSQPTLSLKKTTRQLQKHLEKTKLSAGVIGLKIDIPHDKVALLPSQQATLDNKPSSPHKQNNAEREQIFNDHRVCLVNFNSALLPEQSFDLSPVVGENQRSGAQHRKWGASLDRGNSLMYPIDGLRLLPAPIMTEITTEHGYPSSIMSGRAHQRIDHHDGPWQFSGSWWEAAFDRLYYQMQMPDQRSYLCFYDRLRSQWYLHGIFD